MISEDVVSRLNQAINNIIKCLDADRATLFLVDDKQKELWSVVGKGLDHKVIHLSLGKGIAGAVASTGQLINLTNAYDDNRFDQSTDQDTGYITKSLLCVPILAKTGKVIGVVQVINKKNGVFNQIDESLLTNLSMILALTIENTRLFEQVSHARSKIGVLLDVANAISAELDLDTLLRLILNRAAEVVRADRASLFLVDNDTKELYAKSAKGIDELRFPMNQGIAGEVAITGETINIPDAYSDNRFNKEIDKKTGYFTRNLLSVPIINTMGDIIGVLQVMNRKEGTFKSDDEEMLRAFSAQAGIAIENAKMYEDVLQMKDHLDSVLQSLTNGVISVDKKGKINTVNEAFCSIFGLSKQRLLGRPLVMAFQRTAMPLISSYKTVVEKEMACTELEAECKTMVGEDRLVNINAVPLLDQSREMVGVLIVVEDLTKEKRIRSNLVRYMAKDVLDHVMKSDDLSALGGKRVNATILFSDIRSFTSLTESSTAIEIVEMLNEYFTHMVDAIFKHHGVLDKFIGDAIMAVFGPPIPSADDPLHAVMAALEMKKELAKFNLKRRAQGKSQIAIGVGISSGSVVAGSIGSQKRMDYTSIGDDVNLASRLEGVNKVFGTEIIISEYTYSTVKDKVFCRELDSICVKGKVKPVKIYEVRAFPSDETRENEFLETFDQGLAFYKTGNWSAAIETFNKCLLINPKDKPTQIYIDRCEHFIKQPPETDWDGVWKLTEK